MKPLSLPRPLKQAKNLYENEIWQASVLEERSIKHRIFAFLRVVSIAQTGLSEIRLFGRAAALSYSSLLGIGPLIAIAVMVAGTILQNRNPDAAVDALNRALTFIAPQLTVTAASANATTSATATSSNVAVNPELVSMINNFIEGSRSGTLGVVGGLTLVVIVIQLFISVEESFNAIWGVRRGRPLLMRIVMYWTLVTLGAVLAFGAISLLSAATFLSTFESLPFGNELRQLFSWLAPMISFVVLTGLLMCFYRFIPNTNVFWFPAFVGAVVVVVLLFLNNYLAFFYVKRVLQTQSLFGPLSIMPILMFGLYIFWLFVLLGGQITYAVQNVNYRSSRSAWDALNQHSRESLSLLVLVLIARRFKACETPPTASEISASVRVPTQVLNECLNRLIDLRLVSVIPPGEGESSLDYHYQPARPLARISLREFRDAFARLGASPAGELLDSVDPVLRDFHARLEKAFSEALGEISLEKALDSLPQPGGAS